MPYCVVAVVGGFKVKKDVPGRSKFFSKSPLTRVKAEAQMRALYVSEGGHLKKKTKR